MKTEQEVEFFRGKCVWRAGLCKGGRLSPELRRCWESDADGAGCMPCTDACEERLMYILCFLLLQLLQLCHKLRFRLFDVNEVLRKGQTSE